MSTFLDGSSPSYISGHSADVILSEIRPIKLKIEALQSINVLLDEFLFSILKNSGSLLTDNLRASLLSLLPTTLGKEALLEAEVELRAYWDREACTAVLEDDSKGFHLQWTFELLRMKCEAYSTLNESDEDPLAESRTAERMTAAGGVAPHPALVAPAALYLTAILEALCEHILSNVSRVVARDSSRASATVQDVFTALCEDHTVYGLFRKMQVYEQIEQLSKTPKVRRSKSLTKNEKSSRTSSPFQENRDSSGRSRVSSETPAMATNTTAINSGSRSSFEKTRAIKMFRANNSRASVEGDATNGHKRSGSSVSEKSSRHTSTPFEDSYTAEDEALQQEFDDLMRSSSTMKVSLTPDRLKTMEAFKQEKERGNRRPGPVSFKLDSDPAQQPLPPRTSGRRPSLVPVDSIKEDDEESSPKPVIPPATRNRQASVTASSVTSSVPTRVRSVSTSSSNAPSRTLGKPRVTALPTPTRSATIDQSSMQNRRHVTQVQDPFFPPRTRKIQRNRESLDLDDVMAGSDDDDAIPASQAPNPAPKLAAPAMRNGQKVSASTRDLIDFLSEGPPDMGVPAAVVAPDPTLNGKSKGTGRLQKMISKLSLSNGDRSRSGDDLSKAPMPMPPPPRPVPPKPPLNNMSSLANYPVPPRPPPAPRMSPPTSPQESNEERSYTGTRSRSASLVQKKAVDANNTPAPSVPPVPAHQEQIENGSARRTQPPSYTNGISQSGNANVNGQPQRKPSVESDTQVASPVVASPKSQARVNTKPRTPTSPVRKPAPVYVDPNAQPPHISREDAHHMHRLFSRATTADECRLIFDMFLARSGIPVDYKKYGSYPPRNPVGTGETDLEATLLELFLGGEKANAEPNPPQKNLHTPPVELAQGNGSEESTKTSPDAQSAPNHTQG
ncbi:hypothetical protein H0H92_007124 [Tricholoma furcatifolium]|nr:hypothetical protein H0H92_007124 [Tricholoma furcatifolium]